MNLVLTPGRPLRGSLRVPGDKSLSHRAAVCAALAQGQSTIENFLVSGVTQVLLEALTALGVSWSLDGCTLQVESPGAAGLRPPASPIDCGNSATTLRLLAGLLAAAGTPAVLDGSPGLRRRPMRRIVSPLQEMGVQIECSPAGGAPLKLAARPWDRKLRAIVHTLPVASAQVKSCLLLAGLAADGPVTLVEPAASRDHTERMLGSLGIQVLSASSPTAAQRVTLFPPPELQLPPLRRTLPGDFSSAAFLLVAALITPGSEITLLEVGLNPTRIGLLEVLKEMGGSIRVSQQGERHGEPHGEINVRHSALQGVHVTGDRVVRMIDEFPVFAIAAAFTRGTSTVSQAGELRHKESDRITALCRELRSLGVDAQETADGFVLPGTGGLHGGAAAAQGDHRLAMALAVAGLAASGPVTVQGAEIIAESFPGFVPVFRELGAEIETSPASEEIPA